MLYFIRIEECIKGIEGELEVKSDYEYEKTQKLAVQKMLTTLSLPFNLPKAESFATSCMPTSHLPEVQMHFKL